MSLKTDDVSLQRTCVIFEELVEHEIFHDATKDSMQVKIFFSTVCTQKKTYGVCVNTHIYMVTHCGDVRSDATIKWLKCIVNAV